MSLTSIMATGTFVGNGASRSISIGWRPAAVWLVSGQIGAPDEDRSWSIKTDTMPGDGFQANDTESRHETADGITLGDDGFDVGSSVKINKLDVVYHYVAFRAGHVSTGTYTGDGVDGRKIVTWKRPALVTTMEATGSDKATVWKWANVDDRLSAQFRADNHVIEAVDIVSDGFELGVGTSPPSGFPIRANVSGETYHWMALYEFDGSTRQLVLGAWNGDASDPQKIATWLCPKFVMVYGQTRGSLQDWGFVVDTYLSDRTSLIAGSHLFTNDPNERMTILPDGIEASGEWNKAGEDYRYIAGYF
jgi:hypothetical protein